MRNIRIRGAAVSVIGLLAFSATGAAAQGAVISVAQDGSGDFDSISAAIEAASDGDAIRIAPGTYVEGLTLDKDLVISGQGDAADIVIEPPDGLERRLLGFEDEAFEVLIYAEDSDVVVEHLTLGEVTGYGIAVIGGAAEVSDVVSHDEIGARDVATLVVSDSDLLALWVSGPGQTVARDNTLREGARVLDGAQATFEGNEVFDMPIVADGGSRITVTGNTFRPTDEEPGVVVVDPESSGHIVDNQFIGGWSGIVLEYPVETLAEGNTVDGAAIGIVLIEGTAVARGNMITDAGETGILVVGEGSTIEGNTIEGGRVGLHAHAIPGEIHPRATDHTEGPFIRDNTITGASHFGVIVEDVPAELTGNTICAERQSLKIEGEANLILGTNEICEPEAE